MGGNRTPIVDQRTLDDGSEQWVARYHASLMGGGPVIVTVPGRLRRISVQEAAAIQSFPLDMPWHGSQSSRYRQVGNAVPPKMAYAVATSVANALGIDLVSDVSLLDRLSS